MYQRRNYGAKKSYTWRNVTYVNYRVINRHKRRKTKFGEGFKKKNQFVVTLGIALVGRKFTVVVVRVPLGRAGTNLCYKKFRSDAPTSPKGSFALSLNSSTFCFDQVDNGTADLNLWIARK